MKKIAVMVLSIAMVSTAILGTASAHCGGRGGGRHHKAQANTQSYQYNSQYKCNCGNYNHCRDGYYW